MEDLAITKERYVTGAVNNAVQLLLDCQIAAAKVEHTTKGRNYEIPESYYKWLFEKTADQPAGTPVPIPLQGLELEFAQGYASKRLIRRNRRKQKKKLEKPHSSKSESRRELISRVYECLTDEDRAKITKAWDKFFAFIGKDVFIKNTWWSDRLQANVIVECQRGGKNVRHRLEPKEDFKARMLTNTYIACGVHQLKTEVRAMKKLKTHVTPEQFQRWIVTGTLMEVSKRSGVTYIFRRLRPTLAMRQIGDDYRFLAALCHHPVAYYKISWAGALVPTDDLLSHLLLMRADEHTFWKKSTQHSRQHVQADF